MTVRAYAKINLGLHVLQKREDGYHDIETVFHRINVFDEITFESSSTISLTCNRPDLPADEGNLCVRAALLLQKALGTRGGVHMSLKKNIPLGAGLGGGSSDAAAILSALPQWWNEKPDDNELLRFATSLGADVPYFLKRGTAYATGKGELLEYFSIDIPYWIVVVYPNLHISTSWAYQSIQVKSQKVYGLVEEKGKNPDSRTSNIGPRASDLESPAGAGRQTSLKDILREHIRQPRMLMSLLRNDFEPTVLRAYEPVARVKQALYVGGALFAQMSGSGSSVFGFYDNEAHAGDVASELGKHYQVFVTPPHFEPYG